MCVYLCFGAYAVSVIRDVHLYRNCATIKKCKMKRFTCRLCDFVATTMKATQRIDTTRFYYVYRMFIPSIDARMKGAKVQSQYHLTQHTRTSKPVAMHIHNPLYTTLCTQRISMSRISSQWLCHNGYAQPCTMIQTTTLRRRTTGQRTP